VSLWAELVRLGLRWLMKPSSHPGVTITRRRERIGSFQRWVPRPPAGTEIVRGELGRVPALFVATPPAPTRLARMPRRFTAIRRVCRRP